MLAHVCLPTARHGAKPEPVSLSHCDAIKQYVEGCG